MNYKRIAAILAVSAIIGSSGYAITNTLLFNDVVSVSSAVTLRRNSSGSEVTTLQKNLISLGYLKSGSASGTFDSATEKAVKQFQADYHLTADGVAGSQTLNMISSLVSGTTQVIEVKATLLNVRQTASPQGRLLTTVKVGQKFAVEGEASESDGTKWYKIRTGVGTGYVCSDYVAIVSQAAQAPQTSSDTSGNIIKVTGTVLNVRKSASITSAKLYTVKSGQTFSYTDIKTVNGEVWYFIKVNSSISGWVLGKWTTPVDSSDSANSDVKSGTLKVVVDILQVRKSTSTTSKRLYTTKRDQEYSYSNVKKVDGVNWYYIKVNNSISGWVLGTMVKATPKGYKPTTTSVVRTTSASSDPNGGSLTVTAGLLNVRESASTSSKKLFTAKKDSVYAYSKVKRADGKDWYYIKVNNSISGWVLGDYVDATPYEGNTTSQAAKTAQQSSSDNGGKLTVEASVLNVRSDANTGAKIVTTVRKGTSYSYTNVKTAGNEKWYYISVNSNQKGWVIGSYVSVLPDEAPAQNVSKNGTLTVIGTVVNVRSGAGTDFSKITTVKKDETYSFTDVKNGWYCIKLSSGKTGWVIGDYIKATSAATTADTVTTTEASADATATTGSSTTVSAAAQTTTTKADADDSGSEPMNADPTEDKPSATQPAGSTTAQTANTTTGVPVSPTAVASVSKTIVTGTVSISANALLVRQGPGTNYSSLGTVSNGATVVIVSRGDKWHQIEYGNGTGYVSADCIKSIQSKSNPDSMSYAEEYCYIKPGQSINLGRTVSGATVTYFSSDQKNCPVTDKGIASGVKEGLYTITAKCGSNTSSVCVVVLKDPNSNIKTLQVSERGVDFIAGWEGGETILPNGKKVFYPYKDVSGFWTLGYGHSKTSTASKTWSEERAISEFNSDISKLIGDEYKLTSSRPYLTEEAAKLLLRSDLNNGDYAKAINNWASRNGVILNQAQFDALVSFCYNIGPSLWNSDTNKFYLKAAIIAHRSGSEANADQIIDGFCRYHKSNGKPYKGLWYRRRNEAELFLKGDYAIDKAEKFKLPSGISWL